MQMENENEKKNKYKKCVLCLGAAMETTSSRLGLGMETKGPHLSCPVRQCLCRRQPVDKFTGQTIVHFCQLKNDLNDCVEVEE